VTSNVNFSPHLIFNQCDHRKEEEETTRDERHAKCASEDTQDEPEVANRKAMAAQARVAIRTTECGCGLSPAFCFFP
jgi:hypothetical protein